MTSYKLPKSHRLRSHTAVELLFDREEGGSRIAVAFPLRAVWRYPAEPSSAVAARFMVTIPKKRLRRAVDRVLMRRRVREAYRLNHGSFPATKPVDIAFIYLADMPLPYGAVEAAVSRLLARIRVHSTTNVKMQGCRF